MFVKYSGTYDVKNFIAQVEPYFSFHFTSPCLYGIRYKKDCVAIGLY